MLIGQMPCNTLEIASKVTGRMQEEIVMLVKKQNGVKEVLQALCNSVVPSGRDGNGTTTSSGLILRREMDAGALFIV